MSERRVKDDYQNLNGGQGNHSGEATAPRVYAIVLNWNNYEDTKKCLLSLEQARYPDLVTVVVDNGSPDGSGKRIQNEFPNIKPIFNATNLGFARGCNVGIRAALDDKYCSYVLLINNDAVATPHFLDAAVDAAEANNSIGLVGGKILYCQERREIWYAGGDISLWRGQVSTRGFREVDRGQYDTAGRVGFVTGALMLIKREVLKNVGLLPEEYFFGVEEIDYSIAVMRAGYQLYYVPEFLAYHGADGSHSNYDPKFVYNNYRSKLILQEKYLPKVVFPLWKIAFRLYGTYVAKRIWQKLRDADPAIKDKRVPFEDFSFAMDKALKDHGTNILSEDILIDFDRSLKRRTKT